MMTAQIRHIAIVTERYTLLARFYEALFGLWTFPGRIENASMGVSDGHVGLNFNLRPVGRQAGLDHFGLEVADVDAVIARSRKFRGVDLLRRPSNRPFAGMSMNDPLGNVFDLAHADPGKRDSVYGESASGKVTSRCISHFLLRAMDPALLAEFYSEVFDLIEIPRKSGDDPSFYLSDGTVTMVITPWRIADYAGTGVSRPSMDHLGFTVENLGAFKKDLAALADSNSAFSISPLVATRENARRLQLLKTCGLGTLQLADPDGVLLDVSERHG